LQLFWRAPKRKKWRLRTRTEAIADDVDSQKVRMSRAAEQTTAGCARLGLWVFLAIGAMFGIELLNAVRIWANPVNLRKFPYDYVSKGIWSFGAFVRPPDDSSTDFSPTLTSMCNILGGNRDIYRDFQLEGCSFLYPPTAVIELFPFAWLVGPPTVRNGVSESAEMPEFSPAIKMLDLLGRLCALVTVGIAAWFLRPIVRKRIHWLFAILIFAAFFPLRWLLTCVNIQSLITLMLAILILAYAGNCNVLAGVMLGLAACLKPYLAILLLFAVFRKQWAFILGAVVTAGLLILASTLVVGISPWQTYFFDLLPVVARGYGYIPNQSINGIVHRCLGHPIRMVVGPESIIVSSASWFAVIVFIGSSICPRPIKRLKHCQSSLTPSEPTGHNTFVIPQDILLRAVDVAIAVLAVTLASPVVWDHYFAWCIILFAICLAINYSTALPGWFLGLLCCSYILLGTYLLPVKATGALSLLNSTYFFGAVLLLGVAWYAQLRLYNRTKLELSG